MNYSELLQLAKGWGDFVSDRINIGALTNNRLLFPPLDLCVTKKFYNLFESSGVQELTGNINRKGVTGTVSGRDMVCALIVSLK